MPDAARVLSVLLAGGLLAAPPAAAEVAETVLDNGLRVLVLPDDRAPVVVSQLWYGVGAAQETPGATGLSHLLEHMMFRGTTRYPGESFSRIIDANGGRDNAYTSRDYTAYYQTLSRDRLEVALELEADRLRDLTLDPEDFRKELEVVREERRLRTEDQPEAYAYEQLQAAAFQNHAYGQPLIGWMEDLEQATVAQLRAWRDRWYAPGNARLVVVGDARPEAVFALARKHFGDIPARPTPPAARRPEPAQRGARRVELRIPAQTEYLLMGFKAPALNRLPAAQRWEAYALSMLASLLDGGNAARLPARLVRGDRVAATAGAYYPLYGADDGLLMLEGVPAEGRDAGELEAALLAEVRALQEAPATEAELQRARAQVIAQAVYARDSLRHRSHMIGMLETVGLGWEVERELADRYRAVTAAQVQEVARRYLVDRQRTTVAVHPLPAAGR